MKINYKFNTNNIGSSFLYSYVILFFYCHIYMIKKKLQTKYPQQQIGQCIEKNMKM